MTIRHSCVICDTNEKGRIATTTDQLEEEQRITNKNYLVEERRKKTTIKNSLEEKEKQTMKQKKERLPQIRWSAILYCQQL